MNFEPILIFSILAGGAFAAAGYTLVSLRFLGLLQQCGYDGKRLLSWYFRKGNVQRKRISLLTLSLVLLTALFALSFSFLPIWGTDLVTIAPFVAMIALYFCAEKKYALKVPVRYSARGVRLLALYALLLFACSAGLGFAGAAVCFAVGSRWLTLFRFVPVCLLPMAALFLFAGANFLMEGFEIPHNRKFVRRAAEALAASPCIKVGITGSFGKTSVKHYAEILLSGKFRVIATPASYNTPMGIARTVEECGTDCDIFLAEMGARHTGDIAELCDLVRPDYGVVVGVCAQHVETFGSVEKIAAEKEVLARRVKRCVLGRTADFAVDAVREGRDFFVENVALSPAGTSFDLVSDGKRMHLGLGLLGRHAAEDVALAVELCRLLGMTDGEIAERLPLLAPVPHRLERLERNGLVIFDDAYNSNVEGAKNALEVLSLAHGRKFVVTPGLVELGLLEEEKNRELGAALAGFEVILVGETLVLPVRSGYLEAGGEEARLKTVPTLAAAQEILSRELVAGDSVLFLNDLPDLYR